MYQEKAEMRTFLQNTLQHLADAFNAFSKNKTMLPISKTGKIQSIWSMYERKDVFLLDFLPFVLKWSIIEYSGESIEEWSRDDYND